MNENIDYKKLYEEAQMKLDKLEKYKNVEEPKKEELTPEEAEKEMEKLKAKFEPKTPEALKERS